MNEAFMRNLNYVSNALLDETMKENPEVKPEVVRTKILERRYNLQYGFDNANINDGCGSPASLEARDHYEEFSKFDEAQVAKFIQDKTSGE